MADGNGTSRRDFLKQGALLGCSALAASQLDLVHGLLERAAAAKVDSAICPKGQAGHQGAYDPYRIRKVLKRAGKRGENRWTSIPFDQAVDEIVKGGKLFAHEIGRASCRE